MKNVILALVLTLSSGVALSGEVGAQNPQIANPAPSILEVALAETGASTSWAVVPFDDKVTAHQLSAIESKMDSFYENLNSSLEALLQDKLQRVLQY